MSATLELLRFYQGFLFFKIQLFLFAFVKYFIGFYFLGSTVRVKLTEKLIGGRNYNIVTFDSNDSTSRYNV